MPAPLPCAKRLFVAFLAILCAVLCAPSYVQARAVGGVWTRLNGDGNTTGPVYGVRGVPSPENNPGTTEFGAEWVDQEGNLWLLPGYSGNSPGNAAMWKYDVKADAWAWMSGTTGTLGAAPVRGQKGTFDAANTPGRRVKALSWTAPDGMFWLYGGLDGSGGSFYGDLMTYNPATLQWAWVSGTDALKARPVWGEQGQPSATAFPGARAASAAWVDAAGNLWLYGGLQPFLPWTTDVWKYDPGANQWTWVKGDKTGGSSYGELGIPNPTNNPETIEVEACWTDNDGSFWMFGGLFPASNALWRYAPADNTWTWIGGSSAPSQTGIYGTLGVASEANMPGSRWSNGVWKDLEGNAWLFGGQGCDESTTSMRMLGDMWMLDSAALQWTWMGGSKQWGATPVYGELGVPDAANTPGSRMGTQTWTAPDGTFYLMGGIGMGPVPGSVEMWRYTPEFQTTGARDWEIFQ